MVVVDQTHDQRTQRPDSEEPFDEPRGKMAGFSL